MGVEIVVWFEIVLAIFVFWMVSRVVAWFFVYVADKIDSKGNHELFYAPSRRSIRNLLFCMCDVSYACPHEVHE
jgi:hypothetical protein